MLGNHFAIDLPPSAKLAFHCAKMGRKEDACLFPLVTTLVFPEKETQEAQTQKQAKN
jgi:hypothetical protein